MERKISDEPKSYKHERLINDFNQLQIRIKAHLFDIGDDNFKKKHPKPSVEELDKMLHGIISALKSDSHPQRKY